MGRAVVHFEISGPDHQGSAKFFADLFGWEVTSSRPELFYSTVDTHAGGGINGGFGSPPDGQAYVAVYAAVDDLQATLDRAESLGGKTRMEPMDVPDVVTLAMLSDPAGNPFGIIKDPGVDAPPVSRGDGAPVDWFEVLGGDAEGLRTFYEELFGWSFKEASGEGYTYWLVDTGAGAGAKGGVGSSQDGQPQVNVYAHVDDLQKYLDRAEAAGAKTIVPPMPVTDTLSIAHVADPNGARFGLYVGM
jgi:predicted enzyme related to lactoylglutathione lyase